MDNHFFVDWYIMLHVSYIVGGLGFISIQNIEVKIEYFCLIWKLSPLGWVMIKLSPLGWIMKFCFSPLGPGYYFIIFVRGLGTLSILVYKILRQVKVEYFYFFQIWQLSPLGWLMIKIKLSPLVWIMGNK